jgi:hypothetical protein
MHIHVIAPKLAMRLANQPNAVKSQDQRMKPMSRQHSVPTELDELALRNVKKQTRVHTMSDGQGTPLRLTLANIRGALRSTARP